MVRVSSLLFGLVAARRVSVEHNTEVMVAAENEVCCLCFEVSAGMTHWTVKTYHPGDDHMDRNGWAYEQCRFDRGDGESDCSAHCAAHGKEALMQGCMKRMGMVEWRDKEAWSEGSWTCETDAADPTDPDSTCGCPSERKVEDNAVIEQWERAVASKETELAAAKKSLREALDEKGKTEREHGHNLLETDHETEEVVDKDFMVAATAPETEVCCLCYKETGLKTDWMVKAYSDDADADVNGVGFEQCRLNRGDGESDCSAHCAENGMQMKGCMKSTGMKEWRTARTENSGTCASDSVSDSCSCGADSLLESESEETMCVMNCITKANGKVHTEVQVYSRTYKIWCGGKITARNERAGITVHYTCKGNKLKKLIPWKEANGFVRTKSIMGR